jgi:hypothetical protein
MLGVETEFFEKFINEELEAAFAKSQEASDTDKLVAIGDITSLTAVKRVFSAIAAKRNRIIVAADHLTQVFFDRLTSNVIPPPVQRSYSLTSLRFEVVTFDNLTVPLEMQRLIIDMVGDEAALRYVTDCIDTWDQNPGCLSNPLAFQPYSTQPKIATEPDCECTDPCACSFDTDIPLRCTCYADHTVPDCVIVIVPTTCERLARLCAGWNVISFSE